MVRWLMLMLALVFLAGCASGDPNAWRLYAKASYLYGRIEAKSETHCAAPVKPDRVDFCREAGDVQRAVKATAPILEAELSRQKADWDQIMRYVDLILSLAAKAL